MNNTTKLALAITAMTMGGGALAGTDTTAFDATASIVNACVVGTPTNMAFGSLALLDAATGKVVTTGNDDATGSFSTACTNGATGVTFTMTGTAAALFEMDEDGAGSAKIAYTLFSDSGRTVPVLRSIAQTSANFADFAADGADHVLSVYGRVALASMVAKPVGTYTDTVTVTVTYTD